MATWHTKSDLNIALRTVSSAIDIIEHAMRRGDDHRLIFTEVDFFRSCLDNEGNPDKKKLESSIGKIITSSPERAKLLSERLCDEHIDHSTFNVLRDKASNSRFPVKNSEKTNEIAVTEETWIVTHKRYEKAVTRIVNELSDKPLEIRDAKKLIDASKDPVRGFELTTIRNVNSRVLSMMEDKRQLASVYATNKQPDGQYTIAIPSNEKDAFIKRMYASIGHISGTEGEMEQAQLREQYTYEDKHLLRAKDDRKPFFIADLSPNGKFSEGVIVDKAGVRRVIFEKDKTYVVEFHKRESSHFDFQAAYLIGRYKNPGYLELSGSHISRDDILKMQDKIRPDKDLSFHKAIDGTRQIAINNKNYIVQHYLAPVMQEIVSDTLRESAIGRIRDAKWHALENGLTNEAAELGRDEAEGSASLSPRTRGTLRGIDMGTVNHEGFNYPDEFCFKSREEFGRAIGLNETEMKLSGFLTKTDDVLDRMINASADIQKMTLEEVGYFYHTLEQYKDIEYEELTPELTEELMISQKLEIMLDKTNELSHEQDGRDMDDIQEQER